jgi:hypothetical protein
MGSQVFVMRVSRLLICCVVECSTQTGFTLRIMYMKDIPIYHLTSDANLRTKLFVVVQHIEAFSVYVLGKIYSRKNRSVEQTVRDDGPLFLLIFFVIPCTVCCVVSRLCVATLFYFSFLREPVSLIYLRTPVSTRHFLSISLSYSLSP